jgi:hypothetical protein
MQTFLLLFGQTEQRYIVAYCSLKPPEALAL